jgi:hypothetical protein
MKRSSGSRKTASNLPESIHQRLSVYALVAVAISLLVLSKPSEARIVYTPTQVKVDSPYNLDLNHDGITDFTLGQIHSRKFIANCATIGKLRGTDTDYPSALWKPGD